MLLDLLVEQEPEQEPEQGLVFLVLVFLQLVFLQTQNIETTGREDLEDAQKKIKELEEKLDNAI